MDAGQIELGISAADHNLCAGKQRGEVVDNDVRGGGVPPTAQLSQAGLVAKIMFYATHIIDNIFSICVFYSNSLKASFENCINIISF